VAKNEREHRLLADLEAMENLKADSTILSFETDGEPADRYKVCFKGKGLRRDASTGKIDFVEQHECEIRLTLSYPRRPPDIRWLSPLFHPNISFGGFIRLRDVGMSWTEDLALDVVSERLWDVARLAYYDLENATSHTAKSWLEKQSEFALPVDLRPLRDKTARPKSNVVRYSRKGDKRVLLSDAGQENDLFYIGEDTPVPPVELAWRDQPDEDDDVLYIGDE